MVGAAKLGKEVFSAGKAGYKTTRSFMARPHAGNTVSERQRMLDLRGVQ